MSKTNTKYTSQHIDNQSFDDGLQVRITELIGADGILKNPATEEKQDATIAAINGITIPAPVGGSTEAKQDDSIAILGDIKTAVENPPAQPAPVGGATEAEQEIGNDFLAWFKQAMNRIIYPPWFDRSANAIRNQVQSGTITTVSTVTTVTTVTGLTNIDSYQGKLLIINQNISAWANLVRGRWS